MDDEVELLEDGVTLFAGVITKPIERGLGGTPVQHIETRIECADFWVFTERVLVTDVFIGGTLLALLTQLVDYIADAPYSVTLHPSQATGPTLNAAQFTFKYLNEIFEEVTTWSGGYIGTIDEQRRLRFSLPDLGGASTAPYNVSFGDGNAIGDIEVESDRDKYANRIWMRGGANAPLVSTRHLQAVYPVGVDLGDFTEISLTGQPAISFAEQPAVIIVNSVNKTVGAPGTLDNGQPWEWLWNWITSGPVETMIPKIVHNDLVYGNIANGTNLELRISGPNLPYYNIAIDGWIGNGWSSTDASYRWYWGAMVDTRNRGLPPHTIYINGTPTIVGAFNTINDISGQPWDWVWNSSVSPSLLGHRLAATPLTSGDAIYLYSLAQYELIVQAPDPATEPTAEQTARGLTEVLIEAPDVFDGTELESLANQVYTIRLNRPKRVAYTTHTAGKILPGQVQEIALSWRGLSGNFYITDVSLLPSGMTDRLFRRISAMDSDVYVGSWRETYLQWSRGTHTGSGSSSSSGVVGGGGGGGGGSTVADKVYLLATGIELQESGGPTWIAASSIRIRIDSSERPSLSATVFARLRALSAGVSVKARLYDTSTPIALSAESSLVTSTSWQTVVFNVTLTAGVKDYELQLLPGTANQPVGAMAYLE